MYKPYEYVVMLRKASNRSNTLITLFLMSILFVVISHLMGCTYFFIGRHEVYKGRRYDKQTIFEDVINRDFLNLKPVVEMPIME